MHHVPTPISQAAAKLFRDRQLRAIEVVRSGRMDQRTAGEHLKPWLAIACLCWADVPELDDGLLALRTTQIVWPPELAGGTRDVSEAEARFRLAHEICPRARWVPVLVAARDQAWAGPLETKAQKEIALALRDVASFLQFDASGRHDVPRLNFGDRRIAA